MNNLKIEYIDINDIKPNEYNPKRISIEEEKQLEKSITEFGIVDPLILNCAKGRENIIIGGHQRYKIFKKLGYKQVPVIYISIPDLNKEKELCLRLSKNVGEWDWDLLANFDDELLKEVGFNINVSVPELQDIEIKGESQVMKEYILIEFDTKEEYENLKKKLGMNKNARVISFQEFKEKLCITI